MPLIDVRITIFVADGCAAIGGAIGAVEADELVRAVARRRVDTPTRIIPVAGLEEAPDLGPSCSLGVVSITVATFVARDRPRAFAVCTIEQAWREDVQHVTSCVGASLFS